jgi:hypothetical protein
MEKGTLRRFQRQRLRHLHLGLSAGKRAAQRAEKPSLNRGFENQEFRKNTIKFLTKAEAPFIEQTSFRRQHARCKSLPQGLRGGPVSPPDDNLRRKMPSEAKKSHPDKRMYSDNLQLGSSTAAKVEAGFWGFYFFTGSCGRGRRA